MAEQHASGHLQVRESRHGPVLFAKFRPVGGKQTTRKIGPLWTTRGRS